MINNKIIDIYSFCVVANALDKHAIKVVSVENYFDIMIQSTSKVEVKRVKCRAVGSHRGESMFQTPP